MFFSLTLLPLRGRSTSPPLESPGRCDCTTNKTWCKCCFAALQVWSPGGLQLALSVSTCSGDTAGTLCWWNSQCPGEKPRMNSQPTPSTKFPTMENSHLEVDPQPCLGLPVILHGAFMSYLFRAIDNCRFMRKVNNCCCSKPLGLGWFVYSHGSLEYGGFMISLRERIPMCEGWIGYFIWLDEEMKRQGENDESFH